MNNGGRLIIMTPNYYYEKYLSPLKRILDMPLNLVKWPTRVLKGKFRQAGALAGLKKIFRIRADRGELNRMMHVNVSTPAKIRKLLGDYEVSVWCEDYSRNIASILTQKWWGRDIVAVARKRS